LGVAPRRGREADATSNWVAPPYLASSGDGAAQPASGTLSTMRNGSTTGFEASYE
jgi:hypothetical protein